jgi:hypothetical protein
MQMLTPQLSGVWEGVEKIKEHNEKLLNGLVSIQADPSSMHVIGAIKVCFVQYQTLPVDLTPNQPSRIEGG